MATPEKISLYNLAELKNTSDDAIPNYLNSLKFRQSHYYTDVRLAIGYSSFLLAAACFLWDYKYGFESTKIYTGVAVAVYGLLSLALTMWISDVEKGSVYSGTAPSGEKISIVTTTKKHDPTYNLSVTIKNTATSGSDSEPQVLKISRSFSQWFDEMGVFVVRPFQEFLASEVPIIGKRDPKRVKTASQDLLGDNPDLLDAVVAANAAATTAAEPVEKKGGKRRKAA